MGKAHPENMGFPFRNWDNSPLVFDNQVGSARSPLSAALQSSTKSQAASADGLAYHSQGAWRGRCAQYFDFLITGPTGPGSSW